MTQKVAPDLEIVSPEDKRLIEAVTAEYRPEPMNAIQQAAFRRRLEERLERRSRLRWAPGFALAATAIAAVVWFTAPRGEQPGSSPVVATNQAPVPVLYAFVDPSDYDGDRLQARDFLPDDYLALASALDVPVDNP
jgi:hypothetical protein